VPGGCPELPENVSARTSARVIWLSVAGAVGGFLFGFDSSVVNGAVDAMQEEFTLSSGVTGFLVAIALLGCAAGAYTAGKIADRFGRLPAMKLGALLFIISSLGTGLAFDVWDLALWRVIGGVGIGIASVIAPAYISEISPRHVRGRLASMQQLAITTGIFAALLTDAILADSAQGAGELFWLDLAAWRWMFIAGVIPALVYGWIAYTLPESPRYLVLTGKIDEARRNFKRLGTTDADQQIQDSLEHDSAKQQSPSLRGPAFGLHSVVWIGIILSVLQQFVGINVIFYYSTSLWRAVGFQEQDSFTISVVTAVVNVLVTVIAIVLVDRIGRRPILLAGSLGMGVSLGAMSLSFAFSTGTGTETSLPGIWAPIALISSNIFVISFGASWGPVVWVLLGEIFPSAIRARALGFAAAAQWIANFLVTLCFPAMANSSLPLTYATYAVFAAASYFFVKFRVPETKGMSLEQAETLFASRDAYRPLTEASR